MTEHLGDEARKAFHELGCAIRIHERTQTWFASWATAAILAAALAMLGTVLMTGPWSLPLAATTLITAASAVKLRKRARRSQLLKERLRQLDRNTPYRDLDPEETRAYQEQRDAIRRDEPQAKPLLALLCHYRQLQAEGAPYAQSNRLYDIPAWRRFLAPGLRQAHAAKQQGGQPRNAGTCTPVNHKED